MNKRFSKQLPPRHILKIMNIQKNSNITVSCPTCQKKVPWDVKHTSKPFCSERCKLIDLGEWAAGENKIPGDPAYSDNPDNDSFLH